VLNVFPNITTNTNFAAVGIGVSWTTGPFVDGFAARYDAESKSYIIAIPVNGSTTGALEKYDDGSASWWTGRLNAPQSASITELAVLKPGNSDLKLTYTTMLNYYSYSEWLDGTGAMAFGTATPAAGVPATGSATYAALVSGIGGDGYIGGSATLSFDFGAGELAGHFDPIFYDIGGGALSLGRYDFANTVYGKGSTSFSGDLTTSGIGEKGSFAGMFTGPNAEELMSRWSAPYKLPGDPSVGTMIGVWVGGK
jgi:hypothetical protein